MRLRTVVKNVISTLLTNGGHYECGVTRNSKRLDSAFIIVRNGKQYIAPQARDSFGRIRPIRIDGDKLVLDDENAFTLDDPGIVQLDAVENLIELEKLVNERT